MGMTMTQKILAKHAGMESVENNQFIMADLDMVLGNDITTPVAINEFHKMTDNGVFNKDKIAIVMDHFVPAKDIKSICFLIRFIFIPASIKRLVLPSDIK